jgi:hypothetical protein
MFHFLKGEFKKGPNSVCSFLYLVIKKLINENSMKIKSIIIFSDACPGQNRNYTILKFLVWVSMCFKIKIIQIFPVRGHSYCECDRNFANFSKFIKKIEKIESPEVYINFLKESDFDVNKGVSYNFENFLKPYFKPLKKLLISKASKIEYLCDGSIKIHETYNNISIIDEKVIKNGVNINNCIENLEFDEKHYISKKKSAKVNDLLKYIKNNENQNILKNHLLKYTKVE